MNATTTTVLALFTFLVCAVVFIQLMAVFPTMDRVEWEETTHKVKKGESLWSISGEYCPDNVDRQEWISKVHLLNDLPDSIIHPGQCLTVLKPMED